MGRILGALLTKTTTVVTTPAMSKPRPREPAAVASNVKSGGGLVHPTRTQLRRQLNLQVNAFQQQLHAHMGPYIHAETQLNFNL